MTIKKKAVEKTELEVVEQVVKKPPASDPAAESIESILKLLRGIGPVLAGSHPDPSMVEELLAGLKDPR